MELQLHKLDKGVLIRAVGLMLLSWAALPFIYHILAREKRRKEEKHKEDDGEKRPEQTVLKVL